MSIDDICISLSNMLCQTVAETQCKQSSDYQCLETVTSIYRDFNKICQILADGYCYEDSSIKGACRIFLNKECVDQSDSF